MQMHEKFDEQIRHVK